MPRKLRTAEEGVNEITYAGIRFEPHQCNNPLGNATFDTSANIQEFIFFLQKIENSGWLAGCKSTERGREKGKRC